LDRTDWFYDQINQKEQTNRNSIGFTVPRIEVIERGFCIRTKEKITYNPSKPLSWNSYQTWAQFSNADFKEKYCHSCGKSYSTSVRRPLCNQCQ
jgi:hypothetical protein